MLQAQSLHTHVHTHTRTCGNTHKDAEALDGAHLHVETPKAHAHAYMWETAHVCTATYTNMHTRVHERGASQAALVVKNPPAKAGDARDTGSIPVWGRSPGEGTATHSSLLVWRVPRTEEPGGLQSIALQSRTRLKQPSLHSHSRMLEHTHHHTRGTAVRAAWQGAGTRMCLQNRQTHRLPDHCPAPTQRGGLVCGHRPC